MGRTFRGQKNRTVYRDVPVIEICLYVVRAWLVLGCSGRQRRRPIGRHCGRNRVHSSSGEKQGHQAIGAAWHIA